MKLLSNCPRKPAKSLDKSFSDNIILLYQKTYSGFNFKHFYEYFIEEEKKYIPPMSHPWKQASFKQQMKKAHTERVYA